MDVGEFRRRPIWPWLATLVVLGAGTLVLVAQAQAHAAAQEEAQRRVSATAEVSVAAASGIDVAGSAPASVIVEAAAGEAVVPAVVAADPAWAAAAAGRTGVPERAVRAYASAALTVQREQPACGLGWNTLAGLGAVESGHGTHSGGALRPDGYPDPPIRGIALDGSASAAIADTDGGRFDGDARWDRAVGPLQFIPATWERWGADANGDGVADPNQIDDAALAAARYLCASGEMTDAAGWRRAVYSYNHLDSYVDAVAATANAYAARAAG